MATIHLRIQKETLEKDESVLHLMPCKIHGDAPAKISSYFSPYIRRVDDEHLDASFRGHPLNGTNVTVPKGYRGLTFYEHKRPDPDATERNLYSTGNFSRFTYWNYDKIPSRNDAFAAALDWIDIAEAGRIKKIMQTDEEVGKVAQAVPIIISRTLELFVHSLLTKTMQITSAKNAKTLSPSHMKQCILSESRFDFLKDLVKGLPDVAGPDEETPTPPPTPAAVTTDARPTIVCPSAPQRSPRRSEAESTGQKSSPESGGAASDVASALPSPPHVPEFQISVPTSFRVGQPNFYTEVNPIALTTNPTDMSVTTPPTSNFDNTANIDEDYDT